MKKFLIVSFFLLASVSILAAAKIPSYSGPVTDLAGLLDQNAKIRLEQKILAYRDSTTNEIGILLIKSLDGASIEDYSHDVFNVWGVGKKDKDNGVLFVLALKERETRLEVGYGLGEALTDLECKRIIARDGPVAQKFRNKDFAGGINELIDGVITAIAGEYSSKESSGGTSAFKVIFWIILIVIIIIIVVVLLSADYDGGDGFFLGSLGDSDGGDGFSFGGGASGGGGASSGF